MITRKALKAKLQAMDNNHVLCAGVKRTSNHRGYAVEVGLKSLVGDNTTFGQSTHCTGLGKLHNNPKWFVQLYTDLMWATGDVTVGSVLYALN